MMSWPLCLDGYHANGELVIWGRSLPLFSPVVGFLGVAFQVAGVVEFKLVIVQVPLVGLIVPVFTWILLNAVEGNVRVRGCLSLPVMLACRVPSVLMVKVRLMRFSSRV